MSLTKVSYSMITGAPVNVLDYGADPTGVANSTDAFYAAASAINAADGGHLIVPAGTYIVGKQTFAGATGLGYAYRASYIIRIANCTKPVLIDFQGVYIKIAPGLKFGSFNPVTGVATAGTIHRIWRRKCAIHSCSWRCEAIYLWMAQWRSASAAWSACIVERKWRGRCCR